MRILKSRNIVIDHCLELIGFLLYRRCISSILHYLLDLVELVLCQVSFF